MAAVDPNLASWLKDKALYRTATPSLPSGLQAMAIESELISPFAASAAADTELARQALLFDQPLAMDNATVQGRRIDLVGRCITLKGDQLGYDAGIDVLVIQAVEQEDATTQLLVLRPL